jgi:hypothetical protein
MVHNTRHALREECSHDRVDESLLLPFLPEPRDLICPITVSILAWT